jgi:FMN phosphatase YigB (HAD superfamily)
MKGIIFDWNGTLYEKEKGTFSKNRVNPKNTQTKIQIGLVTLGKEGVEERRRILERSGILHYFDSVIVDTSKSAIIIPCMNDLGNQPLNTYIVDDRTKRGIMIGNALGCKTFWIQKGEFNHELPDEQTGEPSFRIDSVEDLMRFL